MTDGPTVAEREPAVPDAEVELFERSFEEAPVAMLVFRDGIVQRVNGALEAMMGISGQELVGRTQISLVHPDDRESSIEAVRRSLAGEQLAPHDRRVLTASGATLVVRLHYSVLGMDDGARSVLLHVIDRTAEVQAEHAREQAFRLFETSFSQAPVGMFLMAPDGRLLRANEALCALLGRPPEDLLAYGYQQLARPDDLAANRALLRETLDGVRDRYDTVVRLARPDGSMLDARISVSLVRDETGLPEHFVAQLVDLTALERARHALEEVNARLQAVLDHSPTAIYLIGADQRWQVVNEEAAQIIGRPVGDLIGRPLSETFPPGARSAIVDHHRQIMAGGEALQVDETILDARTSQLREYVSLRFPIQDASGDVVGIGGVSLDVTARDRAQRELTAARELFERSFLNTPVGMLISRLHDDGTTTVVQQNAAFAAMTGRRTDEVVDKAAESFVHPGDLPERRRMLDDMAAGRATSGELRFKHADGQDVWALVAPVRVDDADGGKLIVLHAVDISERKRLERRLQYFADHDMLTGLFSRRRLEEELAREVARVRRNGGEGCLLLLDLDGFKTVNDAFGHSAGDELLTGIGDVLRRVVREADVVARLGGDEFAVILPDTDASGGLVTARKLVKAVKARGRSADDRDADVTASVGLTTFSGASAKDAERLLVEADFAMYQAKENGKDRCAAYQRLAR